MKKVISSLFLFLTIINFSVLNVKADNIDPSKVSSITINYQYDDVKISDTKVSLYYLASIDTSGQYLFQDKYLDISFEVGDMSTSQISLKAKEILSYVTEKKLQSDFTLKTQEDGTSYFANLVPGLYLISIDSKVIGDYQYNVSPTLVTIPTLENGTYQYDVLVNTKTEREKIEQEVTPPDSNDDGEKVPNTLDNIYLYIGLLLISFLLMVGVMIYILRKKGGNKDENKK